MKALQTFSADYLRQCRKMRPEQIVEFLETFRSIQSTNLFEGESKLISIKIPKALLRVFRKKCDIQNVPYQTQIKILMKQWLFEDE